MAVYRFLHDRWDEAAARTLDGAELLRYRSNLLGADLRITNFGGGNTSAKLPGRDPVDGGQRVVLWVKGSGGDLGSIQRAGFATLDLARLEALRAQYRGVETEDAMVELYPLCASGKSGAAPSIDTPLHALLPFGHIDHLHPDWAIALAAAANGREKLEAFNARTGHRLVWLPWQRPGFELAVMLRRAVDEHPGCDGVLLGGHGLFTWGESSRACYLSSLAVIDALGAFVLEHVEARGKGLFGGERVPPSPERARVAAELLPFLRGRVSSRASKIGHFADLPEVLRFVGSAHAEPLAALGTSCPDHFIRTKVRPLLVRWTAGEDLAALRRAVEEGLARYREDYRRYYEAFARPGSPAMRDPDPSVVLVPGVGMFSFGKTKAEARITGEFYVNAIHVMEGATALGDGTEPTSRAVPQAGAAAPPEAFQVFSNYVALPLSEAFRIEYWELEEAKLRRQPPERELSRRVVLVVGGGSGIGRATALLAAERGAHVVVADRDGAAAEATAELVRAKASRDAVLSLPLDLRDRASIRAALSAAVAEYGGLDVVVNTAAVFPVAEGGGRLSDAQWASTLDLNVTANARLVEEAAAVLRAQDLEASVVLVSSANAVVPKQGSEAYDVSKAAVNHLVRELAIALAPRVRVNGVSPATVVQGSTMFPRDRVMASLRKYGIAFEESLPDEKLRELLAAFYARRTLTHGEVRPEDCARAILFLAGPFARCTTGHVIPVDGGLVEAFLR
jgi:rhamnose utilization protein RhaD (predicted bifunctional aldolase and dehydrogenase)/NAD(P)-dependent dehydrogenase (short-subunit alcohol dehydrogenase family)